MILTTLLACVLASPPQDMVSQARLMGHLRALPEHRAPAPTPEHIRGLMQTEAWLRITLEDMGYTVHEQRIVSFEPPEGVEVEDPTWHNFWVEIPGSTLPDEVVIVGAHFDAVPTSPGADDNGTGTSAALELARVFKGRSPARTIRVCFFNLEEIGLVGSRFHANNIVKPAVDAGEQTVVGMLSLEMLGYFSDEEGSQHSPIPAIPGVYEPPTKGDFLAIVGLSGDHQLTKQLADAMQVGAPDLNLFLFDMLPSPTPDMRRSDQDPFWQIGVPAVMVTDTSEFRTPNYHKMSDRVETIDVDRFTMSVRAIAAGVWGIANEDESSPD